MPESPAEARESAARAALAEITAASDVGELLDEQVAEGVATLSFATTQLGYPGWRWTVALAELPGEAPSVLEAELLPGEGALLAPDWVPWADRLEEYRAAQAAAGEDAELELADDDDADDAELHDLHDDEPDEGIDFELDAELGPEAPPAELATPQARIGEQHEPDNEPAEADAQPARKSLRSKLFGRRR